MKTCRACGDEYRKGKLAFVLTEGQGKRGGGRKLVGGIVCPECAAGGLLIVAPKLAPVIKKVEKRSDEVQRALRQIQTLAKATRASARGVTTNQVVADQISAKAEGLESAISVLENIGRIES